MMMQQRQGDNRDNQQPPPAPQQQQQQQQEAAKNKPRADVQHYFRNDITKPFQAEDHDRKHHHDDVHHHDHDSDDHGGSSSSRSSSCSTGSSAHTTTSDSDGGRRGSHMLNDSDGDDDGNTNDNDSDMDDHDNDDDGHDKDVSTSTVEYSAADEGDDDNSEHNRRRQRLDSAEDDQVNRPVPDAVLLVQKAGPNNSAAFASKATTTTPLRALPASTASFMSVGSMRRRGATNHNNNNTSNMNNNRHNKNRPTLTMTGMDSKAACHSAAGAVHDDSASSLKEKYCNNSNSMMTMTMMKDHHHNNNSHGSDDNTHRLLLLHHVDAAHGNPTPRSTAATVSVWNGESSDQGSKRRWRRRRRHRGYDRNSGSRQQQYQKQQPLRRHRRFDKHHPPLSLWEVLPHLSTFSLSTLALVASAFLWMSIYMILSSTSSISPSPLSPQERIRVRRWERATAHLHKRAAAEEQQKHLDLNHHLHHHHDDYFPNQPALRSAVHSAASYPVLMQQQSQSNITANEHMLPPEQQQKPVSANQRLQLFPPVPPTPKKDSFMKQVANGFRDILAKGVTSPRSNEQNKNAKPPKPDVEALQPGCVAAKWHSLNFPNCNDVHEVDLLDTLQHAAQHAEHDPDHIKLGYLAQGLWRSVWAVEPRQLDTSVRMIGDGHEIVDNDVVVLKMMKLQHEVDERNFDRHRRDALVMERLAGNPNVVDVYGFCGNSVLTEFITTPLDDLIMIKKRGFSNNNNHDEDNNDSNHQSSNLTDEQRLDLALGVARGMACLHGIPGGPVVHADIQARQFLVTPTGVAKINDFNRCRFMARRRRGDENNVNNTSSINKKQQQETCPFRIPTAPGKSRAPEEYNLADLDQQLDIYSLANIYYEILTGRGPWDRYSSAETKHMIVEGIKPGLVTWSTRRQQQQHNSTVDDNDNDNDEYVNNTTTNNNDKIPSFHSTYDALAELTLQMYELDPHQRPTAQQMVERLEYIQQQLRQQLQQTRTT